MKNTLYKIILSLVFMLNIINIQAQRNVAWVHGLKGDSDSWEHYNTIFDNELNINSIRETYDTDHGIAFGANEVKQSVDVLFGSENTNSNNLAITHSMGGLMVRHIDANTNSGKKRFGGYITTTSPIYGAPIANSIIDGSVNAAAQNALSKLTAGPISQLFNLPYSLIANLTTSELSNFISVDNLIEESIGSEVSNTDLRVGSPTINAINAYDTNNSIPRISIWASENSPVHWRMFSSSANDYNDQELVDDVNTARGIYNGFYIGNTSLAITCAVAGFWYPPCWVLSINYTYRAVQWKKGRDWIDTSETMWCSLIKTTQTTQTTYWVEIWVPCGMNDPVKSQNNGNDKNPLPPPIDDPNCGEWVWVQETHTTTINYPSDGLLPEYTQIMQNNPTLNNTYHVSGANHIEVRNMTKDENGVDETKNEFLKIFHNRPNGDFFRTN